ncbi:A/G-specific adenine glycosylase [Patescibacteria group bacterium AH-259-L07]|nr:A/G-specific adenine glycosylase [Patescibacteria group bacterium AH-259-L07]
MDKKDIKIFQNTVYQYYKNHGRTLPWRQTRNPYHIFISEIMLQQTQVSRVCEKYPLFIFAFPNFTSLARAPLRRIMKVWQGMGYNRRALMLKKTASVVMNKFNGKLPASIKDLITLPGVGETTAGAIAAFAFNKPVVFIETNIRSVFIHFFFNRRKGVKDSELLPLVEQTLDRLNPREWYYALMDYGAMLKKIYTNPSRTSAHYLKQAPFQGSDRQIRGMIIKVLVVKPLTENELTHKINKDSKQIKKNLLNLCKEGLIKKVGERYQVA